SLRKQNGDRKQCPACGSTQVAEATKEEFEATKPPSLSPTQSAPKSPTKEIEDGVNRELRLNDPPNRPPRQPPYQGTYNGGIDQELYADDVQSLRRDLVELKREEIAERRERLLDRRNNGGNSAEAQKLRDENRQLKEDAKYQRLEHKFDQLLDHLSRPGKDSLDIMLDGYSKLRNTEIANVHADTDTQLLKNQGRFMEQTMDIVKGQVENLNKGVSRLADVWETKVTEKAKAEIRGNVKVLDGEPPKLADEEALNQASQFLMGGQDGSDGQDRYFCSQCNANHLRASQAGEFHSEYEVKR
ncbi:MAG: hypothetical protein LN417_04170, partial [Candidatus Thermoplasmatota archaeon]|nr:hypothetical protein [Candidatus Thermoplasmatota archaeon]